MSRQDEGDRMPGKDEEIRMLIQDEGDRMLGQDGDRKPKQDKLDLLYRDYCGRFPDKEIVRGGGCLETAVVFVGEAPGRDEVKLSKPFVGMAGRRLSEMLAALGIGRDSIYITNAIKYRLSKPGSKTGRTINRPASRIDIIENKEYLHKEIDIIKPKCIVTLGNVPLRMICGDERNIGEFHGICGQVELYNRKYFLFPLYHPASMIYNPDLKAVNEADICKLKMEICKL